MSPADVVIALIIAIAFILSVRKIIRSGKTGECGGCSHKDGCSSHSTGHCDKSQDLVNRAAQAVSGRKQSRNKHM